MTTVAQQEKITEAIWSAAGQIIEGQELQGHEVRVTVLTGGKSINGYYYDMQALQSIARLIEGARAYADHGRTAADEATRSVRDMVGFYKDAAYIPPSGLDNPLGRVDATLHIFEAAEWLWSLIQESVTLGRPDLVGLSIDIYGNWTKDDTHKAKSVTKVLSLNSCDVVTRPSAGGSFQRILHDDHQGEPNLSTDVQNPPENNTPPANEGNIQENQQNQQITEQARLLEAQQQMINEAMNQIKQERCALTLDRRLLESGFPEAITKQVRASFSNRIFEEAELETSLQSYRDMMAELSAARIVRDSGWEKPTVSQMITEAEKVQAAFDRMFGLEIDTNKLGNVQPFEGIREAYSVVTGDAAVSGENHRDLGRLRIGENAPVGRITEADTTTASFSYLLGTSMNKRLLKDYQAWPAEWQKFVTITPIKDFKQQTRVRFGAFGSLSTVAEDTAYTSVTLTDSAATYVPTKRGNLVTVSRETIVNDDLFAIKQIPTKLAVAAAYTLAEFVYNFLSANGNIYDGNALFTSGGGSHLNLGSSALSTAAMQTGVTAMREQTNFAGKRLGLKPSYLIVPAELEFTAMVVTKSAGVPGSVNNDINPMLGYVTPIVSPQLSNTTQWFFAADPRIIDTIEVGFVGGQVNPALFIQDQPLFGLNFTQDVISYKIRHEYGGAVLDFRGLYRGI